MRETRIGERLYRHSLEKCSACGKPKTIEYFNQKLGWRRVNNYDRRNQIAEIA